MAVAVCSMMFAAGVRGANPVTLVRRGLCGNGVVDSDEQCDFNAPGSQQCCSQQCRALPDVITECSLNGMDGVCSLGRCMTRTQQCSDFDANILVTPAYTVVGPFAPCAPSNSSTSAANAATAPTTRNASTLTTDIESSCSLACAGVQSGAQSSKVCLDLKDYGNINSLVADGLYCGPDQTDSSLGLCYKGTCRQDLCRAARCNNRGDCIRSSTGAMQCRCDSPYDGYRCQRTSSCSGIVDLCRVCEGTNSTCQFDPLATVKSPGDSYVNSREFQVMVLPAICVAALLTILLFAFFYIRSKSQPPSVTGQSSLISSKLLPKSGPLHRVGISVRWDEFRCILAYEPQMHDELELIVGDIVFKLFEYDDGWAKGYNTRTQQEGIYPVSFTEKVGKANLP